MCVYLLNFSVQLFFYHFLDLLPIGVVNGGSGSGVVEMMLVSLLLLSLIFRRVYQLVKDLTTVKRGEATTVERERGHSNS